MTQAYDIIIVGAGSAGNVLAARLTEDSDVRVLLLEAGGPDYRFDFRTQMPAALAWPLQGKRYNWAYHTDPEPYMDGRRMECGRGKGLGGSSLINGMCYIRGNALDYEGWAQAPGLADWTYADCLPYFRKAERRDVGPDAYHGGDGPLSVTTAKPGRNVLYEAFRGAEISPGPAVRSDREIDAFVRAHAETAYHPCGSCRMGEGADAVVDGQGRVHGLDGLRVIDASIMPQIVTGNLNAPTIMMAEKIADRIRGRAPLPRSDTPYYVAGDDPPRRPPVREPRKAAATGPAPERAEAALAARGETH